MNVSMTRVRAVRTHGVHGAAYCQDWLEAMCTSTTEPIKATQAAA